MRGSGPRMPPTDATVTKTPPPVFSLSGMAALKSRIGPVRLTSMTVFQVSSPRSATGSILSISPALLTAISSLPKVVTAIRMAFPTSSSRVTSPATATAFPPAAVI